MCSQTSTLQTWLSSNSLNKPWWGEDSHGLSHHPDSQDTHRHLLWVASHTHIVPSCITTHTHPACSVPPCILHQPVSINHHKPHTHVVHSSTVPTVPNQCYRSRIFCVYKEGLPLCTIRNCLDLLWRPTCRMDRTLLLRGMRSNQRWSQADSLGTTQGAKEAHTSTPRLSCWEQLQRSPVAKKQNKTKQKNKRNWQKSFQLTRYC